MTTQNKTWLITGAGRGMGVDIAKAALAAGHNVVATGRNPDAVAEALGDADNLLVVKLDVTSTRATPRRRSRRPSSASAASTCWSTTPPASTPASSRSSRPSRWTGRSRRA